MKLGILTRVVLSLGLAVGPVDWLFATTTYTWIHSTGGDASGSWNTPGNWSPAGPATGIDNSADFSAVSFQGTATATLDGTFSIGNLHFGDSVGAGHAWVLNTGSGSPLTLSVSSGTPVINVDNQQAATINAALSGSAFMKTGNGTLTIAGDSANAMTGDTTVSVGYLVLGKSFGNAINGNLVLTGSETYAILSNNNDQLPSTAVVTMVPSTGYSYWKLMGYRQTIAGLVDNAQGNVMIAYNSTECSNSSTLTLSGNGSYTYSGRLWDHNLQNPAIGTMSLIKSGSGTQTFNGPHIQYTGSTQINQGRLVLGATVHFVSAITNNATVELANGGRDWGFSDSVPSYVSFAGTGTVVKTGGGTISFGFNGTGGAYIRMGTNGLIDVEGGMLQNQLGQADWSQNFASLNIASGAVVDLYQNSIWVDALTGAGTVNNSYGYQSQTLTVGVAGGSGVFSGLVENTGTLLSMVKCGTGREALLGANTYGGATIVSNGALVVDNTTGSGTGTGSVTVTAGAILSGTGMISGPVNLGPAATLRPGDPVGTLTVNNDVALNNSAILQYALGSASARTAIGGKLTLGGTLNIIDAGGFGPGIYVLITYGGVLVNNGLTIGTNPNSSLTYQIDTSASGQVKLLVSGALPPDPYTVWQQQYFHCTSCPQASGDADPLGKGMSNTNQFLAGLDPTNAASVFRIVSVSSSNDDFIVTWVAAGGKTDVVQATSGSLTGDYTTNYQDISTVVIFGSGEVTNNCIDVGGATNYPARYYRVRLGP